MYRKIALAIAFSPRIEALIAETKRLKDLHQASLVLIHIGKKTQELEQKLLAILEKHAVDPKQTKIIWEEGKPAKKIIQICNTENVDLLVAGAMKKEVLFTYYLGSIARKIIRKAACSVLVLIEPSVQPAAFKKIVINGTQQPQTPYVIGKAVDICKLEQAKQVFILNEIKMYGLQMATIGEDSEEEASKQRKRMVNEEIRYVEDILNTIDHEGLKINIKVTSGRWAHELAKFSESIHADLLILGGHENLTFFDRLFPHDIEDILGNLPCNLLIIKK
ncbi:universal stress protein [Lunatibacter salilacus]|uniref:universal stress protein n=1 Tax=Lunatibacter salilacus TaxID=2483804 RepID=UPI00131C043E|nr:universal stress protein [Lunatibacter salilacus]